MARREHTEQPGDIRIPHDPVSEAVVVAAAIVSPAARAKFAPTLAADKFFEPKHQAAWLALQEAERRKLPVDVATLQKLGEVDGVYLGQLVRDRPAAPDNLDFHVHHVLWDNARLRAAEGPVHELVAALRDPLAEPGVVKAMARRVASAFDDYQGTSHLRDPALLSRAMATEVRRRGEGLVSYSYGITRLDYFEKPDAAGRAVRRMIPGAAPGKLTVVTGSRGVGKSTFTAQMVLGLARVGRRVLYGAWEMNSEVSLEMLACMSCAFDRSRLHAKEKEGGLRREEMILLEERAHAISKKVMFMDNPFRKSRDEKNRKGSNQKNLDLLHGYVSESGCEVFVGDLMARAFVELKPDDIELAVVRLQDIAEDTKTHIVAVHQQLTKGDGVRADKRPTAEGAKGSAIWSEAADTMIGIHRNAAYKAVPDDKLEAVILKQRHGVAPMIVEFDWQPSTGILSGGVTRAFDYGQDGNATESWLNAQPKAKFNNEPKGKR